MKYLSFVHLSYFPFLSSDMEGLAPPLLTPQSFPMNFPCGVLCSRFPRHVDCGLTMGEG